MNPGHGDYDKRMEFVKFVLSQFGLEGKNITPLDYDAGSPRPYNNYIYRVSLPSATATSGVLTSQPGTATIPAGTSSLIVRLSNPAAGLNELNRIENEVAAMEVGRAALAPAGLAHLVPLVYGWGRNDRELTRQGWIAMEWKQGINIYYDRPFETMDIVEQAYVIQQMAQVFAALKAYTLPASIKGYGGLTFDQHGAIVNGAVSIFTGGPFDSYAELVKGNLRGALKDADESAVLRGWSPGGVRARLDKFIEHGVDTMVTSDIMKVLTHADFTTANALFNAETLKLTALLDFDFSYVSHPADDYFRTLGTMFGQFPTGPVALLSPADQTLRKAMLDGFPAADVPVMKDPVEDRIARFWDAELERLDVLRPRKIANIAQLSELHWLADNIAPFVLCLPGMIKRIGPEAAENKRKDAETRLLQWLETKGF